MRSSRLQIAVSHRNCWIRLNFRSTPRQGRREETSKMQALKQAVFVSVLFAVLAAGRVAAADVHAGHPRLFFRAGMWDQGRGATLLQVRERYARGDAAVVREQLDRSIPNNALRALILQSMPDSAAISSNGRKTRGTDVPGRSPVASSE